MEMQFADFLRDKIVNLGWTPSDLAARSGVDKSTISLWLNGKRLPKGKALRQAATALNVDPGEMMRLVVGGQREPASPASVPTGMSAAAVCSLLDAISHVAQARQESPDDLLEQLLQVVEGMRPQSPPAGRAPSHIPQAAPKRSAAPRQPGKVSRRVQNSQ
jgi:transcriptional regulator with XRE-family HTH domain